MWAEIITTAILAAVGGGGLVGLMFAAPNHILERRMKENDDQKEKEEADEKAMRAGIIALLHDRLYVECTRCLARGTITSEELRNIEYLYTPYHALGGNGTGTAMVTQCRALPIEGEVRGRSD